MEAQHRPFPVLRSPVRKRCRVEYGFLAGVEGARDCPFELRQIGKEGQRRCQPVVPQEFWEGGAGIVEVVGTEGDGPDVAM